MKKNSLRVANLVPYELDAIGGVQEYLKHYQQHMKVFGHQTTLFGPLTNSQPSDFDVAEITQLQGNRVFFNYGTPEQIKNLLQNIKSGRYDILHVHDPFIPYVSWKIAEKIELPIVTSFHMGWNHDSVVYSSLEKIIPLFKETFSQQVAAAVFISPLVEQCWSQLCDERVVQHTITYGINRQIFRPEESCKKKSKLIKKKSHKDASHIEILFLARLASRKGTTYLLQAFQKLFAKYPQLRLTIVGDGPEKEKLFQYVQKNHLDKVVTFTGFVTGSKKVSYYQRADIFCAPYINEAFGITLLEAMACGCPLVGFENEGFTDMIDNYPAPDLFVKPRDVVSLVNAIETVIENPHLRDRLSSWGVEKSKLFSWEKNTEATVEVYLDVLDKHGHGSK